MQPGILRAMQLVAGSYGSFTKESANMIKQRSKKLVFALAFAGLWLGVLAPARAADILFTATGTFDWAEDYQVGFDQLGLEGASFVFTARFAETSLYQNYSGTGFPFIHSLSDSFTISGSPVAGVNGTYSARGYGVVLLPTFAGQFFGDPNNGEYATWTPNRAPEFQNSMRLNRLTTLVSGPVIGGQFLPSHISTTPSTGVDRASFSVIGLVNNAFGQIDGYYIRNFQASVTVVPEPSSLILCTLAACGLGIFRYRKLVRAGFSHAAQSQR